MWPKGTIRILMVTKRGRRWLKWGVMTAVISVVLMLGAATWFTSEAIEDDLLFVTGGEPAIDPSDFRVPFVPIDVPGREKEGMSAWVVPHSWQRTRRMRMRSL